VCKFSESCDYSVGEKGFGFISEKLFSNIHVHTLRSRITYTPFGRNALMGPEECLCGNLLWHAGRCLAKTICRGIGTFGSRRLREATKSKRFLPFPSRLCREQARTTSLQTCELVRDGNFPPAYWSCAFPPVFLVLPGSANACRRRSGTAVKPSETNQQMCLRT
jgi:hypothetical protein